MRALHLLSVSLLASIAFIMSCSNDNAAPKKCDGTLALTVGGTTNQTSCSPADGSITVSATGGAEPYQYSINGGAKQSSATFNGLSKGSYSITVFDKNNCEATVSSVQVDFPTLALDFTTATVPDTDCFGNNGEISITASGSTSYQYSKDNGVTFQVDFSFPNLEPKSYSIVVKGGDGCTVTKSVPVPRGVTGIKYEGVGGVLEIFNAKCTGSGCHPDKGDWFTYSVAKSNASIIKTKTTNKSMPKTGSLTADEIAKIACWVDDGAPQ